MGIIFVNLLLFGLLTFDTYQKIHCRKWIRESEYPGASWLYKDHRIKERATMGQTCRPEQQNAIFGNMIECLPRDAVVDIPMPNDTSVYQAIPSQVLLSRCSGNCIGNRAYVCTASTTEKVKIPVMYIKGALQLGIWKTVCMETEMAKHTSCKCGCELKPENCTKAQTFSNHMCRCLCKNEEARRLCLMSVQPRKQWDAVKCLCHCHIDTFTECTTGYAFDYLDKCKCVPESQLTASLSAGAATPLSAIIGILACVVVVLVIGLIVLFSRYRHLQSRTSA